MTSTTTFRIYLPASQSKPASAEPIEDAAPVQGRGEVILVVEDEAAVRDLLRRVLSKNGYRVLMACSGLEASQIAREQLDQVDLLVTDIVMPGGVSGRELAECLRRELPRLRVVYCSGYALEITELDLGKGAVFLQKPFGLRKLLDSIAACLQA